MVAVAAAVWVLAGVTITGHDGPAGLHWRARSSGKRTPSAPKRRRKLIGPFGILHGPSAGSAAGRPVACKGTAVGATAAGAACLIVMPGVVQRIYQFPRLLDHPPLLGAVLRLCENAKQRAGTCIRAVKGSVCRHTAAQVRPNRRYSLHAQAATPEAQCAPRLGRKEEGSNGTFSAAVLNACSPRTCAQTWWRWGCGRSTARGGWAGEARSARRRGAAGR